MSGGREALVRDVLALAVLGEGWDGEHGQPARASSVRDTVAFVGRLGEGTCGLLEASLHVDGSVLLELGDGALGSLSFGGDGFHLACAIEGVRPMMLPLRGEGLEELERCMWGAVVRDMCVAA